MIPKRTHIYCYQLYRSLLLLQSTYLKDRIWNMKIKYPALLQLLLFTYAILSLFQNRHLQTSLNSHSSMGNLNMDLSSFPLLFLSKLSKIQNPLHNPFTTLELHLFDFPPILTWFIYSHGYALGNSSFSDDFRDMSGQT